MQIFVPGWYIVEKDCKYSDGTPDNGAQMKQILSVGEVVFAYMKMNDNYLCVSLAHDILFVKGNLTKVTEKGKPCIIMEPISLMDTDLSTNEMFWLVSLDAGKGVATILTAGGQKQEVPSKSVDAISKILNYSLPTLLFSAVKP